MNYLGFRETLVTSAALYAIVAATPAMAQSKTFDIPAQSAVSGIPELARQADVQILASEAAVRGKTIKAVRGRMTVDQALRRALSGTGLTYSTSDGRTYVLSASTASTASKPPVDAESGAAENEGGEILVTGTRIRGRTTASPVIEISRSQMVNEGQKDLGEAIRSLPQNYSGGQNPGVAPGSGLTVHQNVTSGSGLNLRGLGADASLTLLNGRRLAYGGDAQSVDISAVPLGAVERVEVVADGTSALYGSDAVAGVANIITRRGFNGLETTVRYGGATQGGLTEKAFSATAGTTWNGGSVLLAYDFRDADPILSRQRDYIRRLGYLGTETTLYPSLRQHSAFLSVEQRLGGVKVRIDGLFLDRGSDSFSQRPTQTSISRRDVRSYTIAPSIEVPLPAGWTATIGGSYSRDESSSYQMANTTAGAAINGGDICYCNGAASAEASAEGPLFTLPAGDVRIAVGGGYRRNSFDKQYRYLFPARVVEKVSGGQDSYYVFGEASLPLLSPEMGVPAAHRLTVTAALRYEDYPGMAKVATPKLGLVYEPVAGIALKGSWGRSFKAPTLVQQLTSAAAYLYPSFSFGATGYPADAQVVYLFGGNPALKPERAESRTITLALDPSPGLHLEASYFNIDYTDRVIRPLTNFGRVFDDPVYARYLTLNPSSALQTQVIGASWNGLTNLIADPYDPTKVIAIAYDQFVNVARQNAHGFDASGSYAFRAAGGQARIYASASWLSGDQMNSAGQPARQTTGNVFYPASFRSRGGFSWSGFGVTAGVTVEHIAGVTDNQRATVSYPGDPFTTIGLNLRYETAPGASLLSNLGLSLSVSNLLDQDPPRFASTNTVSVNYDSTNYSAIGRYVSVAITKRW